MCATEEFLCMVISGKVLKRIVMPHIVTTLVATAAAASVYTPPLKLRPMVG